MAFARGRFFVSVCVGGTAAAAAAAEIFHCLYMYIIYTSGERAGYCGVLLYGGAGAFERVREIIVLVCRDLTNF